MKWSMRWPDLRASDERARQEAARAYVVAHLPDLERHSDVTARLGQTFLTVRTLPRLSAWIAVAYALWLLASELDLPNWALALTGVGCLLAAGMALGSGVVFCVHAARIPFARYDWVTYLQRHVQAGGIPAPPKRT